MASGKRIVESMPAEVDGVRLELAGNTVSLRDVLDARVQVEGIDLHLQDINNPPPTRKAATVRDVRAFLGRFYSARRADVKGGFSNPEKAREAQQLSRAARDSRKGKN